MILGRALASDGGSDRNVSRLEIYKSGLETNRSGLEMNISNLETRL